MYNNLNYNNYEQQQKNAFDMMNNALKQKQDNNSNENSNEKVTKIDIEKIEFPKSSIKSFNTTIGEQCQLFTSIFKQVIKGYVGCKPEIEPDIRGGYNISVSVIIDPKLMMDDNDKDKISLINDCFSNNNKNNNTNLIDKLKSTSYNKFNRYSFNNKNKSVLKDFCKDLNKLSIVVQPVNMGELVIIRGLDFNKMISAIYGTYSKELGKIEYEVTLTNYSDLRSNKIGPANIIINIQQINEKELNSLKEKLCINYYNQSGIDYI